MFDANHTLVVQTTGHTWDGDLQEFNHLPPTLWLKSFYATILFAACYWLVYPAWPIGEDRYTQGILNKISYQSEHRTVYAHWNTRALLLHTLQQKDETGQRQVYLQRLASEPLQQVAADVELMAFSRALAKTLFGDNCTSCHANSSFGHSQPTVLQETIANGLGSNGAMPGWKQRWSLSEIKALALYVHTPDK